MSSINFNGSIGKANVNTGDGTQVTGDGANVNMGEGTINVGGQTFGDSAVPTVPQVFEAMAKELPAEVVEDTVEPIRNLAALPIADQEASKPKWTNLVERLIPYAPQIAKGIAVFGEAALGALASRNPVVAGVLAICKLNSSSQG